MKKLFALLLVIVMAFSLIACKQKPVVETRGSLYDENGRMRIKWILYNHPNSPYSVDVESEILDYVEEKYNIDIIVESVDIHNTENLGLYVAAGGDADVITASYTVGQSYSKLISEGILRAIPDGWLEEYMPDWMNNCYAAMSPEAIKAQITYTDGQQYVVPFATTQNAYLMAVRQDWLDAIGMDIPTTQEELIEMLIRFHTDDPDGNGVADTYGTHERCFNMSYLSVLNNGYDGTLMGEDGVYNTFLNGDSKEWLKMKQMLVAKGGIDPESITDNEDIWKDKMVNGKIGVFVHDSDYFLDWWTSSMKNRFKVANPETELVIIPPLADENGRTMVLGLPQSCTGSGSLAFGANCPDEVMQMVMRIKNDLASDYEFYMRCKYGVEGVNYIIDENGTIVTLEGTNEDPMIGSALAHVPTPKSWSTGSLSDWDKYITETYNDATKYPRLQDELSFSSWKENKIEKRRSADYGSVINEMSGKVYDPTFDFDAAWPAFVEKLNNRGLGKVVDEWNELLGFTNSNG